MEIIKNKKIFITGGAGFIGSYLCERLVNDNQVVVYDSNKRNALKYTAILDNPNLNLITGDVLDADMLSQSMAGSQIVIHCAAIAGIYSVVESPILTCGSTFWGPIMLWKRQLPIR